MNLQQIEQTIRDAQGLDSTKKIYASQLLDQLRHESNRWRIGLQLFFESKDEVARFFGLSLARDYLSSVSRAATELSPAERVQIRSAILQWIRDATSRSSEIPTFLSNNIASILALLIKVDYPEIWTDAFQEIIVIGATNELGLDIAIRTLYDLDLEVVCFDDKRTAVEISHNTLIKDTMRSTSTASDLVVFLCRSAVSSREVRGGEMSSRCLNCLASFIGWVDIGLIVNEATVSIIYGALRDPRLKAAAFTCLFELCKKGMDYVPKVLCVQSIGLISTIGAHAPTELSTGEDVDEDNESGEEFGQLVNILFLELLGCWSKFEEGILAGSTDDDFRILSGLIPVIASFLRELWPLVMLALNYTSDVDVPATVLTSLTKLVSLLRSQLSQLAALQAAAPSIPGYFFVHELLHPLLLGLYRQMQFDEDFAFDLADDDDAEIVEAKKEVQNVFVHLCRVAPAPCLDLITHVFQTLPQPLSRAPFPQVEAALKLVFLFGQCGQAHKKMISEGTFPALLAAIHQSDVATHAHDQVVLGYFEVAVRYANQLDVESVKAVVTRILGGRGMHSASLHLRARSAYFLLKIAQSLDGKSSILLPVMGSCSDLVLVQFGAPSPLPQEAELHLLEALGIIAACSYQCAEQEQQKQQVILREMVDTISGQIQGLVSHPQIDRYAAELGDAVAHRVSCITSLTKSFTAMTRPDLVPAFEVAAGTVLNLLRVMVRHPAVREKVLIFCHRSISCLGERALELVSQCFPLLLEHMETQECERITQLINQVMSEFKGQCLALVDVLFVPLQQRQLGLYEAFERQQQIQLQQGAAAAGGDRTAEAAHVESERADLQKQHLMFLHHVSSWCHPCLTSERNIGQLDVVLGAVMAGLKGGRGALSVSGSLPLRKNALFILTALAEHWARPSSAVPAELASQFSTFVFDQALPTAVRVCSDGVTLDVKDAATQAILGEVGALLWTLYMHSMDQPKMVEYLQIGLLPSLGWPPAVVASLLQLLVSKGSLNAFRENFKQLLRTLIR